MRLGTARLKAAPFQNHRARACHLSAPVTARLKPCPSETKPSFRESVPQGLKPGIYAAGDGAAESRALSKPPRARAIFLLPLRHGLKPCPSEAKPSFRESVPQGLKPGIYAAGDGAAESRALSKPPRARVPSFCSRYGTAEAVPFRNKTIFPRKRPSGAKARDLCGWGRRG